ncbi:AbrB family transcriptional regulator [Phyllobacterium sp. SB3]|uniref:AbrB family transcriptional regulator n=1 Tax=Phyllobacterium sp. SB3 TaxID=3156073 RepID=UPI0032B01F4E
MPDPGKLGIKGGRSVFDRPVAKIGLAFLIGIAGAVIARIVAMPLPYLLGPLLACGAASIMGAPVAVLPYGRELGQAAVGLAIGLRFTPVVLIAIIKLFPLMLLSTLLMIAATMIAGLLLSKLANIDRRTAFFATAAAGLAEMAVVAHQKNSDSDTVAVVHLIRVALIVTTVPFLVTFFGEDGGIQPAHIPLRGEVLPLIGLFGAGVIAACLVRRWKLPNIWLLIPAVIGGTASGLGFGPFAVPSVVITIAQVVIGIWLGCRFRRSLLGRLWRVTTSALVTTVFLLAVATAIAGILSTITGLSFVTSLLAVAPAGVTEMALTATAMHLDATAVTAFQITRIAVVMTTILFTLRVFETFSRRFAAAD